MIVGISNHYLYLSCHASCENYNARIAPVQRNQANSYFEEIKDMIVNLSHFVRIKGDQYEKANMLCADKM
jgi:hypothetical protein